MIIRNTNISSISWISKWKSTRSKNKILENNKSNKISYGEISPKRIFAAAAPPIGPGR